MIPEKAIKKITKEAHKEIAVSNLIAYGVFPFTEEGIANAKKLVETKDTWLPPSGLPNYYDDIESDLMTGRETAGIIYIRNALKEFYGLTETTDNAKVNIQQKIKTRLKRSGKKISVKRRSNRYVISPRKPRQDLLDVANDIIAELLDEKAYETEILEKELEQGTFRITLPANIKLPPTMGYIQGNKARWEPEFESDLDAAIYFAGKSPLPKGDKQAAVLDWLKNTLGIPWSEISNHRDKVLEKILETVNLPGVEEEYPYVYIDTVDESFESRYAEPQKDEDDFLEDQITDDLIDDSEEDNLDGLDDLLNSIREDDDKEIADNIKEEVETSVDESLQDLPEDILNDEEFINILNKTKKAKEVKPKSGITNRTILNAVNSNFTSINNTLISIDKNLSEQNTLISAQIESNIIIADLISQQTLSLESKFEALYNVLNKQSQQAQDLLAKQDKLQQEAELEKQKDAAGTTGFKDLTQGKGGSSLFNRIAKFFGRRFAEYLWRRFAPKKLRAITRLGRMKLGGIKRIPSRIAGKALGGIASRVGKPAVKAVAPRAVAKGFEHIALPGVTRAAADKPAATAVQKSSGNVLQRALSSPAVQKALVKVLGKEGAEKLTVKIAAKLIPGVSTAYGLGEGLARIAMGDLKGGFLSFGSALPFVGYGFAAVDILRDINPTAYTKHIESNLPGVSDENFAAFFAEALGVTPDQYEVGGVTKKGLAMLHGTELILDKNSFISNVDNQVAGSMLLATSKFVSEIDIGSSAYSTTINSMIAQLSKRYKIPNASVQVPIGGSIPNIGQVIDRVEKKKPKTEEEELEGIEKDILEDQNPESFAKKLLKLLDPNGRFQELLQNINRPTDTPLDTTGITGDLKGNIINPMEEGQMQDYAPAKFGASRMRNGRRVAGAHKGRDIMGPPGMKVVSSLAGTVIRIYNVGKLPGGGWSKGIDIDHGNGIVTKYMHVTPSRGIGAGVKVQAGQQIAVLSPEDDISEGSHLHFEIHHNGTAQDPETFLKKAYKLKDIKAGKVPGLSIQTPTTPSTAPAAKGLGKQGVVDNKNFGATSGVGSKGYLIVPGHAAGGGAPEEKRLVKQLARNAYTNMKAKFPDANIQYQDTDGMFEETEEGFRKQLAWFKQKEKEGWEILEIHMDASIESGQGTGRGVIVPTGELNPVEAYFAQNYGAFSRGHRDLGAPKRGVGLFELGNMSPELQQASRENKVTKQQLDALTAPLETALQQGLNLKPPASSKNINYQSLQGPDKSEDTKFLILNQPNKPQSLNLRGGNNISFTEMSPGRWKSSNELSTQMRNLYLQRLAQ